MVIKTYCVCKSTAYACNLLASHSFFVVYSLYRMLLKYSLSEYRTDTIPHTALLQNTFSIIFIFFIRIIHSIITTSSNQQHYKQQKKKKNTVGKIPSWPYQVHWQKLECVELTISCSFILTTLTWLISIYFVYMAIMYVWSVYDI